VTMALDGGRTNATCVLTAAMRISTELDIQEAALESIQIRRLESSAKLNGRHTPESLGEDKASEGRIESAQLVEEGIREAEHDQMFQVARAAQRPMVPHSRSAADSGHRNLYSFRQILLSMACSSTMPADTIYCRLWSAFPFVRTMVLSPSSWAPKML